MLVLVAIAALLTVGAGRASAYWSPSTTACSSGAPQCYVWRNPQGVIVEDIEPISQLEFENLTAEAVAAIDEVAGKPTTGLGTVEIEAGRTAAAALETEADPAVLSGAEGVAEATGVVGSFSALGTFFLGASAFTVGWSVGEALDGLLGIEALGVFGSGGSGVDHFESHYATSVNAGAATGIGTSTFPASGLVLRWCESNCTASTGEYGAPSSPGAAKGYLYDGQPSGFSFHPVETIKNRKYPQETVVWGYWFEAAPALAIRPHSAEPFPGVSKTVSRAPGASRTLAEQKAKVASSVLENPEYDGFNEWLPAHDGIADHKELVGAVVTVPNCDGLLYASCSELLEERGLKPNRVQKDWRAADTDKEADEVIELEPARSTEVERGSTVTVVTNPDEAGMPVVIPAPGADETYAEYVARLNPALSPHEHLLGEVDENPSYGPNAVTGTSPAPGTRVDPSVQTQLSVSVNPSTAADPGSSSAWSPPGIDPIDLSPITNLHVGCNTFPFGIFCWLKDGLTSWGPGGSCPSLSLPFIRFDQGPEVGEFKGAHLESSTCGFEPAMEIIRPTLVVLACISIAAMFAYAALGIGGQAGSDD